MRGNSLLAACPKASYLANLADNDYFDHLHGASWNQGTCALPKRICSKAKDTNTSIFLETSVGEYIWPHRSHGAQQSHETCRWDRFDQRALQAEWQRSGYHRNLTSSLWSFNEQRRFYFHTVFNSCSGHEPPVVSLGPLTSIRKYICKPKNQRLWVGFNAAFQHFSLRTSVSFRLRWVNFKTNLIYLWTALYLAPSMKMISIHFHHHPKHSLIKYKYIFSTSFNNGRYKKYS